MWVQNRAPLPKLFLPERLCIAVGNRTGVGAGVVLDSKLIRFVLWEASKVQSKVVWGQRVVHSELLSQKIPLGTESVKLLPEIHNVD